MLVEQNRPRVDSPYRWNERPKEAVCPTCGKRFVQRSRNNVYCCVECRPSSHAARSRAAAGREAAE